MQQLYFIQFYYNDYHKENPLKTFRATMTKQIQYSNHFKVIQLSKRPAKNNFVTKNKPKKLKKQRKQKGKPKTNTRDYNRKYNGEL